MGQFVFGKQPFSTAPVCSISEEIQRRAKAHSIALLMLFARFGSTVNGLASREQKLQKQIKKMLDFDPVKARRSFCQHRIVFLLSRRVE